MSRSAPEGQRLGRFFPDQPLRALAIAACKGDIATLREKASQSPNSVQQLGNEGMSLIVWAMMCDQGTSVTTLIELGADPNQVLLLPKSETTATILAVRFKNLEMLRILLANGAKPDLVPPSRRPNQMNASPVVMALHMGIEHDMWDRLDMLLAIPQDIDVQTSMGTAISFAVSANRFQIAERMLEMGSRENLVDIAMSIQNSNRINETVPRVRAEGLSLWRELKRRGLVLPLTFQTSNVDPSQWPKDPITGKPDGTKLYYFGIGNVNGIDYWIPE
jgi:ankyrin repeat protein